ncbi:hypothetical protein BC628DRAFT_462892 [Trametes gibbosa]|nr:hypothetical protein BC628DRAFT_462892 [Trametes gibbosa]
MSSYYIRNSSDYNGESYANSYTTGSRSSGQPSDRDIKEGLSPTSLQTLSKPQALTSTTHRIQPAKLKYIGSYNWVEQSAPTIIVPGAPPLWRDRAVPFRVAFDSGMRMVDQNGYRMGSASSLLPLFRAVDVVAEEKGMASVDWPSVDVVTDRNGLRKLLRWIGHSGMEEPPKEFRIDLQLGGGKTVLMQRWEKRTREAATPPKSGYGHNFEDESTSPARGCERSTGHHRIVQYELDGLKLVVRFEVDACTAQPVPIRRSTSSHAGNGVARVDSITDALRGLNVSSTARRTTLSGASAITVIRAGGEVSQSSIVELKTRSKNYVDQFDWVEQYPQLFLSYTPNLFLAVHNRGTFERIKKHTLGSAELHPVETDPQIQRSFKQLVAVLRTIQELVKSHGLQGRLTLVCQDGVLRVYQRTSSMGTVPAQELARFNA